jgi:predicted RNase H-like HicB family nuclease
LSSIVNERDEHNYYVASIPQLLGCRAQGRSLDDLSARIREAAGTNLEFAGIQRITVAA